MTTESRSPIGTLGANLPTAETAVQTLMPPYFFDCVESDGVVKFVKRGESQEGAL